MRKAKNTESSSEPVEATEPVVEVVEPEEGLPTREALEVALEEVRDKDEGQRGVGENDAPNGAAQEVTAASAEPIPEAPRIEPPAEWNAEEKADFLASSPKAQEAALRLHRARQSKLEEIKRESGELQWVKDLAKEVTPFIKVRGGKEPTHAQLVKAVEVVNRIDSAKNAADIVAILEAKNLPVPDELRAAVAREEKTADPQISAVLQKVNQLESIIAEGTKAQTTQVLQQAWSAFEQERNAAGAAKYPDLGDTEPGLRLARNIGSLVGVDGPSPVSEQFIASVRERIPGATFQTLLHEAYRFLGGRVDDSTEPPKTQTTQTQIIKAKRAASAIPGRAASSSSPGVVKRYKTYREAAQAALEQVREQE